MLYFLNANPRTINPPPGSEPDYQWFLSKETPNIQLRGVGQSPWVFWNPFAANKTQPKQIPVITRCSPQCLAPFLTKKEGFPAPK
jgi:hypothetical protein